MIAKQTLDFTYTMRKIFAFYPNHPIKEVVVSQECFDNLVASLDENPDTEKKDERLFFRGVEISAKKPEA